MEHVARRQAVYLPVGVAAKALDPIVMLSVLEHWEGTGQMRAASHVPPNLWDKAHCKNDFPWRSPGEGRRRATESMKCVVAIWALV